MYRSAAEKSAPLLLILLTDLTITIEAAVASILSAVPASVWSALKLMHATASNSDDIIPVAAATNIVSITIRAGAVPSGSKTIVNVPPIAPKTIIPSRPMLITPERSENIPPSATRMRTAA